MTVRQLIHSINFPEILIALSVVLNFEAVMRQVAVNKGYKNVVSWCDQIASAVTFILDVFSVAKNKQVTKVVPMILLCAGLSFAMGCASYNQKAVCLQLGTTNASIPYVGGATSGSGFACYYSCLGYACPAPIAKTMTNLMNTEATANNNSIITSGPVKVTATPLK